MTSFRRLRPRYNDKPAPIQCSAVAESVSGATAFSAITLKRRTQWLNDRPHLDPARCTRNSTVEIGGKPYCAGHAGSIALRIMLGESE